jgi:alpha-1,2-mannosyltransferase
MIALSSRRWWLAGCASAALILTRPTTAVAVAVAGVWCSLKERSVRPALRIGLVGLLGVGLLVGYTRILFSQWALFVGSYSSLQTNAIGKASAYSPTHVVELLTNIAGFLVSPSRGLLVLSPFLLLLIPGLRGAWSAAPSWVKASALGAVSYALIQLWTNNFGGGSNFYGYRYALEPLTLASPLLVLAWQQWTSLTLLRRRVFAALSVFSIFQFAAGAVTTDSVNTSDGQAWHHYLLIDSLQGASIPQLSFMVLVPIVAGIAALLLESRWAMPPTRQPRSPELIRQRAAPSAPLPDRPNASVVPPIADPAPPSR